MSFADVLKLYLDKANCTAKELSAVSGISASTLSGYSLHTDAVQTLKNIQIQVNVGKWVIVSKNNAPSIRFVIKHPKMIRAFEDFCKPTEK